MNNNVRNNYNYVTNIIAILFFPLFILFRPGLFGHDGTVIGVGLAIVCIVLTFFTGIYQEMKEIDFIPIFFISLFWLFVLLFGAINESNLDLLLKSYISNSLVVIVISVFLLSNKLLVKKILYIYALILSAFGYSCLVTLVFFFSGHSVTSLEITELSLGYDNPSKLLFPFSVLYHDMHSGTLNILRFQSLYRESGIAQCFFLWGAAVGYFLNFNKWIILGLVLGLIATFSTTGISIAFILFPLAFFVKNGVKGSIHEKGLKIIFSLFLISFFFYAAYYATFNIPYFGIASKLDTHNASISDRLPNVNDLTLIGAGFYSEVTKNSAINLLKASESLGLLLTFLYIFIFSLMSWVGKSMHLGAMVFVSILPIFITSVVAQPIIDAPLVYLIVYMTRQVFSQGIVFHKEVI